MLIAVLRPLAPALGLVDHPNDRKRHVGSVPLIGGLCMFGGIAAGTLFMGELGIFRTVVLETAVVMAIIGALDDRHDLSVRVRLVGQVCCILTVCLATGVHITTIGHVFGTPIMLGPLGVPLTVVAVIGLLNAFNMMDGIDGLAGCQALVSVITLLFFHGNHNLRGSVIMVSLLAAAALPYLVVNLGLAGRKIFLGDAGSMVIGYLLAWALIRLAESDDSSLSPTDVLWCVAVPVLDTLTVMGRRIIERKSPFRADRGHIHHLLLGRGLNPRRALVALVALSVALSCLGVGLHGFSSGISISCFLIVAMAYAAVTLREYRRQSGRSTTPTEVVPAPAKVMINAPVVPEPALVD